jgi:hypothetical protein
MINTQRLQPGGCAEHLAGVAGVCGGFLAHTRGVSIFRVVNDYIVTLDGYGWWGEQPPQTPATFLTGSD